MTPASIDCGVYDYHRGFCRIVLADGDSLGSGTVSRPPLNDNEAVSDISLSGRAVLEASNCLHKHQRGHWHSLPGVDKQDNELPF